MQNLRNAKFGIPAFFALFLCAFAALRESIFLLRFPPDAGEGGLDLALEAADQFAVGDDQRLLALQVAHLVAPTPQAKGKIERSFQTFQNRLVTLMAHAGVSDWQSADSILQMEIQRRSRKTLRTSGRFPSEVWGEQILKRTARASPAPASTLLNLQFSLPATCRVHRI